MTTRKLVSSLIAFSLAMVFLLFFVPFALNANNSLTNLVGAAVVIGVVIGVIGAVHKKFSEKEHNDA